MKRTNKIACLTMIIALVLSMLFTLRMDVDAAYDYTVRFIIGGTGTEGASFLSDPGALTLISDTATAYISDDGSQLVITGLQYNDEVVYDPKLGVGITPVTVTDDDGNQYSYNKYCVKGIRRSGSDDWVAKSAFKVQKDDSYVVAYGVGTIVEYTVKYQDEDDNELIPTATYYGLLGEEVYIPYRYVDGYTPNTYNIDVLSLEENQEFVFTYKKTELPSGTTNYENTLRTEYSTIAGEPQYIYQTVPRPVAAVVAGEAAGNAAGNAGGNEGDGNIEDIGMIIGDDDVPLGVDDIVTIGDKPTPRAISGVGGYSRHFGYALIVIILCMVGLVLSTFVAFKEKKR